MKKNALFFVMMLTIFLGFSAFLNESISDDPIDTRYLQSVTRCPNPPPNGPQYIYGPCSPGRMQCLPSIACLPPEF